LLSNNIDRVTLVKSIAVLVVGKR